MCGLQDSKLVIKKIPRRVQGDSKEIPKKVKYESKTTRPQKVPKTIEQRKAKGNPRTLCQKPADPGDTMVWATTWPRVKQKVGARPLQGLEQM